MDRRILLVVAFGLVLPTVASAQDATTAGELSAPYPTFENISLQWAIDGDANLDGVVTVQYRKAGETSYQQGLPLFRVPAGSNVGFDWINQHAGSVFGLEPGTEYELELSLSDPDGGSTTRTLNVKTRALPMIPARGREIAVTPADIDGFLASAGAGDVLVLADGTYSEIVIPNDGTATQPLALRATNPGAAVVEGDVRIDGRAFVQVEGLAVHGMIKFNDAESIVISGCTIDTVDYGIVSYGSGVKNAYIVDNEISGATTWSESSLGTDGNNIGEGIQITGPGNVVAWNRVSGFRDCLSLMEDSEAVNQISDDFYGNDLSACADDAIEADFAMGNVRVYRNRIADSFMGISSQPSLGGPTYFVRNAMYNVLYQAFKLQRSSVGDVGLHNTVVKSGDAFSVNTGDVFAYAFFRNNLFIGGPGGTYGGYDSGPGDVMTLPSADATCSFDYDGYGSIGSGSYAGRVGDVRFSSLAEQQQNTTEMNAIVVDLSVFSASVTYPADPFGAYSFPSFSLASGAAAVDQGAPLANVNDGFSGNAPDLGAIELGDQEPTYGPGGSIPPASGDGGISSSEGNNDASVSSSGSSTTGTTAGSSSEATANTGGSNGESDGGGSQDAAVAEGSASSSSMNTSGCGCRVSSPPQRPPWTPIFLGLGFLRAVRRRSRKP